MTKCHKLRSRCLIRAPTEGTQGNQSVPRVTAATLRRVLEVRTLLSGTSLLPGYFACYQLTVSKGGHRGRHHPDAPQTCAVQHIDLYQDYTNSWLAYMQL